MGCSLTNLWTQVRKREKHGPLQQEHFHSLVPEIV